MNKAEIIDKIVERTELPKVDVEKVMSCFFETVKSTLKGREIVRLVGFGTFSANQRKARTGRNPQTGQEYKSLLVATLSLSLGKSLKIISTEKILDLES